MAFFKGRLDKIVNIEKSEKDFKDSIEKLPLEKNDGIAMIIAALVTFIPALVLVGGIFFAIIYFIFLR